MKRYIRASYDDSMPKWLHGQPALDAIKQKYALSEAKFYRKPKPNSIPIYLLSEAYLNKVIQRWGKYPQTQHTLMTNVAYCPDCPSGDISILVGETYMRPGLNMNKTKVRQTFDSLIKRTTYMVAPLRSEVRSEHYENPRVYEPGSGHRDKSGYLIPNPSTLYKRLYAKFPDKAKDKLDSILVSMEDYYNILNEYKDKVFDLDIRNGVGFLTHPSYRGSSREKYIDKFNSVVEEYGDVYRDCEELANSDMDASSLTYLIYSVDSLGDSIDRLVDYLDNN